MCGIVGYIGKKDCTEVLLGGLEKLKYRGYDSAGIAVVNNKEIKTVKSMGKLENLVELVGQRNDLESHCGIGHTRWATHGEPSDVNSHPHGNARITIVHNGIIENYQKIKKFLEKKGYVFESQTDTETVAKLLDYYYNGDPTETIRKVISKIEGSYALGIIFKDFPDTIYAVRKDSPMVVGVGKQELFIASDIPAFLEHTKNYYLVEEDELVVLKDGKAEFYDPYGFAIEKQLHTADFDINVAEKGGYEHFMLKEIHEQPKAINDTIGSLINDGLPDLSESGLTKEKLGNYNNIFVVACGTAMHAGLVGKYLIEKLARVSVTVDVASEFKYRDPIIGENDLVILVSQSGETADTKAAMHLAKEKGADTLAIVNVVGSSIAREADMVIYTRAGLEISVASTKAYTVQLAVFYILTFELALVKNKITENQCREYIHKLQQVPDIIKEMLETKDKCQFVASTLQNCTDLLYIGRGLDYALSMEGSLKLKEISYIHSESYAAGELKHGTISLVTEEMPVIAVATQKDLFAKTISNVVEVKSRGAKVILITNEDAVVSPNVADYIIYVKGESDLFKPILTAIPLQLIAYYTSVIRGNDVDTPRNLAKSVTVE